MSLEADPELLRAIFEYADGELFWKISQQPNIVKGQKAGYRSKKGYSYIKYQDINYSTHRLIYIYHKGLIPEGYTVDHTDRDPSNDYEWNLRLATQSEQNINKDLQCSNTSGYVGICWAKDRRKWESSIHKNNKRYKKCFDDKNDAIAWREAKELELYAGIKS